MAYTDIDEVQTFLKTTFDGTTTPTLTTVNEWITDADAEVDRLTGTTFTATSNIDVFDLTNRTDRVLLRKFPVISLTAVEYNSSTDADKEFNPTWTAFDNSRLDGDFAIFDIPKIGNQIVRVTYQYGFSTTPSEVKHLATLLVVKKAISADSYAKNSTSSLSIGPLSITKNIGASTFTNIDSNIDETVRRVGKYKAILR